MSDLPGFIGQAGSIAGRIVGGATGAAISAASGLASSALAGNPWTPGFFRPNGRSIGGIVAQVTIEEREHDELFITEHPIEQGAPISDHAFKRPSEVNIRAGWSAGKSGDLSASGNGVYGLLLSWQAALNTFDLYTGKRVYRNMLIQSLTVTTDSKSEFALMADIVCRQVIIVRTQTAQTGTSSDSDKHDNPEKTAGSKGKGDVSTRDVGDQDLEKSGTGTNLSGPAATEVEGSPISEEATTVEGSPIVTPEAAKVGATVDKNTSVDDFKFQQTF